MKPLFKWAGSKQRMLKQYASIWHPLTVDNYVDMFAGGLTNTLEIAKTFPNAAIHINDKNTELIQLYSQLANNCEQVVNDWKTCVNLWLANTDIAARKAAYYDMREAYVAKQTPGVLLFMLSVNFNGMWKTYKKCNYLYSTPPGTCLQGSSFFNEQNIRDVADLLSTCTITDKSFEQLTLPASSFVYADPPYRDSIVNYQGGFGEEQQVLLAERLMYSGCQFAYSNKDIHDGFFSEHFPGCTVTQCSATYTAGRGTSTNTVSEVLVTNF
jgi:DNA adenine methylase Dam